MWEVIFDAAVNNGLWAAMFVGLMIYILRDTAKRERKYQEVIDVLAEDLHIVMEIQKDIDEIKGVLKRAE